MSICPGGNRILEAVHDDARVPRLALRELPGLGVVWERPLPRQPASIYTEALKCLDGGGTGYVNEGHWGEDIGGINLQSGQVTPVITGPPYTTRLVLRPDGSALATQAWGNMVWLNANRIGFFPAAGAHPRARIFDSSLRELGGFDNWAASTSLLMGGVIVGLGEGRLTVADLPNGPTRVVEQFESP